MPADRTGCHRNSGAIPKFPVAFPMTVVFDRIVRRVTGGGTHEACLTRVQNCGRHNPNCSIRHERIDGWIMIGHGSPGFVPKPIDSRRSLLESQRFFRGPQRPAERSATLGDKAKLCDIRLEINLHDDATWASVQNRT